MQLKSLTKLFAALLITAAVCIAPALADETAATPQIDTEKIISDRIIEWDGWTWDKSPYQRLSPEWIADAQSNCYAIVHERGVSFADRAQHQAYALGWDKRFEYVEQYGAINDETGEITYNIGFFDSFGFMFSGGTDKWFKTNDEYQAAMQIYNENFAVAVQAVPKEV